MFAPGWTCCAFLDQHRLHDAGETGTDVERLDLLAHAIEGVLILREPRALRGDLRLDRCGELIETLDLDVVGRLERVGVQLRPAHRELGDDAGGALGLGLQPLRFVCGTRLRDGRLLIELFAAQRELELRERGFRDLEPVTRLLGLALQIGIRQHRENRVGLDDGAGAHEDASTRPADCAAIQRITRGTSVPGPRVCTISSPRSTVPV